MSYDGIVTRAVSEELQETLVGGRINRINQPDSTEIHLIIYNHRKNFKLLLNGSSNLPRVYLTDENRKNPLQAPNFCMFLRKHIQNGIIEKIEQEGLDRVLRITVKSFNELGFSENKILVVELMGKYSNLILIRENGIILDSFKKITNNISRVRQILPGLKYERITDTKWDLIKEGLKLPSQIYSEKMESEKLSAFFYKNYTGFSPIMGKEIAHRANKLPSTRLNTLEKEDWEKVDQVFEEYYKNIKEGNFKPNISLDSGNQQFKEFHVFLMNHISPDSMGFQSPSKMLEKYYLQDATEDRVSQKMGALRKIVLNKYKRDGNKLANMENELLESKDRDKYKVYGDLLAANNHRIKRGEKEVKIENFYDPELETLTIPLDVKKSPWENTQYYYKLFSKLKNRHKLLEFEIPRIKKEMEYLNQLLTTMNYITDDSEIEEIREEMQEAGLLKKRKKKKKYPVSKPYHYLTSNGAHVFVGKNNKQNDQLTLKEAHKEDYFVHVKDLPGSHVILKNDNLSPEDIEEAAFLAAYYSSVSKEKYIDVDYTQKKNVRKPKSAKPGMVYYDHFQTLHVDMEKYQIRDFRKI